MLILVLLPLRITNLVSKNECFSINEPHKAAVTQVTTEVFQKLHKLCTQCGYETTIVQMGSKTFSLMQLFQKYTLLKTAVSWSGCSATLRTGLYLCKSI
jgi:hypothetical protein